MINARTIWLTLFLVVFLVLGAQAIHIGGLTGHYSQGLIAVAILLTLGVLAAEACTPEGSKKTDTALAKLWQGTQNEKGRLVVFVLAWLAYPILLTVAGFMVATTVILAISLLSGNTRRPVLTIFLSALVSVVMTIFLTAALYIPVPSGPVDQWLDRVLYALGLS